MAVVWAASRERILRTVIIWGGVVTWYLHGVVDEGETLEDCMPWSYKYSSAVWG